jgi:dipeptidase
MWLGLDKPADTVFIPFHVGVTRLPRSVEVVDTGKFSRDSAWWAFNFLANYAGLKYSYMHREIAALQEEIEVAFLDGLSAVDEKAGKLYAEDPLGAREYLTGLGEKFTEETMARWWNLAESLIVKYNDGLLNEPGKMGQPLGYPQEWLKRTSWPTGPTTYEKR